MKNLFKNADVTKCSRLKCQKIVSRAYAAFKIFSVFIYFERVFILLALVNFIFILLCQSYFGFVVVLVRVI